MNTIRRPVLVPEDIPNGHARREAAVTSLVRACIATALGKLENRPPDTRQWDDRTVDLILRAPSTPATVGLPLAHVIVALLETLRPQSAGADLLMRGPG
jgi:hypothetical protein